MKNPLYPGKIQKRILAITISFILGICIIISYISYYIFQNYLQHSLIQATETNLQLLSDSINKSFSEIDQMVRFCQTNSNIATYIANNPDPGSVLSVSTYDRITEEFNSNPSNGYMTRLAVITDAHFLQIVSVAYSSTANLALEVPGLPFFRTLLEAPGYSFSTGFIKDPFYKNGKNILPILRPITYQSDTGEGGYLFIEVSSDLFTNAFKRYTIAEDSDVYLTAGNHHYRYENGNLTEFEPSPEPAAELNVSTVIAGIKVHEAKDCQGNSYIMVSIPLNMPDCYISQTISPLELQSQKRLLWYIWGSSLVAVLGMGFLLMLTLNQMINMPVSKIRAKMLRVSEGDFDRDPAIEWDHELGEIGRGVNDLCENVLLLMQTRLEDEKQKKDLEYRVLQSQINPHFLYNTLNSIKWMASIQGASGICEMTTALAKLLKSISKGTSLLIPLREELSLLQDYFTIQRYRYGGTITMDVEVDSEELLDSKIIKFTLQPLVENSIFHGIEPKGSGRVTVHVFTETSPEETDIIPAIRIDITDDGVGMSPEKASAILQSNNEAGTDFFREIGVSNVQKRLQYQFGKEYGITVESVEGEFTTMSIRIPFCR